MQRFLRFSPTSNRALPISSSYTMTEYANWYVCTRTAIGKRITPHESTRSMRGNHHYCFVDFHTKEEANDAMRALDGRPIKGGKLKVSVAKYIPKKLVGRRTDIPRGSRDGNSRDGNSNSFRRDSLRDNFRSNWRNRRSSWDQTPDRFATTNEPLNYG